MTEQVVAASALGHCFISMFLSWNKCCVSSTTTIELVVEVCTIQQSGWLMRPCYIALKVKKLHLLMSEAKADSKKDLKD